MTIGRYIEDLSDERTPLEQSELPQLSSLSTEDLEDFEAALGSMTAERKCEMLARMVEMSEEDVNLDFSAVFRACLADEEDGVREAAALGLWECDDRVVLRPLIRLLVGDPSDSVRAAAAVSIGKFAERARNGRLLPRDTEKIRRALLFTIDDDLADLDTRRRAIEAMPSLGAAEVVDIIEDAYESGDARLRQSALYAMGRTSDTRWLPMVLDDVQDDDPAIRYEAAAALGQLGDEENVPDLIALTEDEDPQVQLSAVQALGAVGGSMARNALVQCLDSGDHTLEEAARSILGSAEFDDDPMGLSFQR